VNEYKALTLAVLVKPPGAALEYLHRSPASRKRRQKGNPLSVSLKHPVPGGYRYADLSLKVGRVSNEILKFGHDFCRAGPER
jgi:hypothetical protein